MKFLEFLKGINLKYRRILILIFIFWGIGTFGLGFLGSWFFTKGGLGKFPQIRSSDRILILAPHIDDETIGAGGIILESLKQKAKVKVVWLTNGDDSLGAYFKEEKKLDLRPEGFVKIGQQRMEEGKKAMEVLGLDEKGLIFLGYPDQGLLSMLSKFYSSTNPYISKGTKIDHNPYFGTLKPGRLYTGENLVADLEEIIDDFSPTMIFVSHPRDYHPDHRATFQFLKKVLEEKSHPAKVYAYLVHYPLFPPKKFFDKSGFLYPPKKLFSLKGWLSFELSDDQIEKKLEAVKQYQSQISKLDNLLFSFVKRNEIFEEIEEPFSQPKNFLELSPIPTLTPTPTVDPKRLLDSLNQKYGPCRYTPILMYHHLLPSEEAKKNLAEKLNVPPDIFEKQLDYLAKKGYQTIFLSELMDGLKNGSLPKKPIVLTFDDGYAEIYQNLFPKLKNYNFKATLFIITQAVGGERYLTWEQLKEMSQSGLVEIGDHTLSHPSLPAESEEQEKDQILSAKNILEQRLEIKVQVFAYPYGSFNPTAEKILKEGDFLAAVTTSRGKPVCLNLPYELPRIRIGAASLDQYGI